MEQTKSSYGSGNPCQECRRLKVRCSKTGPPCDQCKRRGVEEICPDGKLTTGRTGRYLLTSAETLHEENKKLKLRIRELEQGLEEATRRTTDESHPLLEPHLLTLARPYLHENSILTETKGKEEALVNQFGTMHLQKGHDKYLGATALSEAHFDIHDLDDDFVPEEEGLAKFALPASMLFSPTEFMLMAMNNLPSKDTALQIIETYYGYATYAYVSLKGRT
ncbi:hypothetical protein FRC14_007687 [Serendipita sp. 396]|nr:hypothetical protein FRC14_007687 [Serendipita sp. 396]KAG8816782.1 hypothetical protein FRC19_011825 [Serendipita sp. 401]